MKKIFFILINFAIFSACNNYGNHASTADSLKRASSTDTLRHSDTASYERMPNNPAGGDSTK